MSTPDVNHGQNVQGGYALPHHAEIFSKKIGWFGGRLKVTYEPPDESGGKGTLKITHQKNLWERLTNSGSTSELEVKADWLGSSNQANLKDFSNDTSLRNHILTCYKDVKDGRGNLAARLANRFDTTFNAEPTSPVQIDAEKKYTKSKELLENSTTKEYLAAIKAEFRPTPRIEGGNPAQRLEDYSVKAQKIIDEAQASLDRAIKTHKDIHEDSKDVDVTHFSCADDVHRASHAIGRYYMKHFEEAKQRLNDLKSQLTAEESKSLDNSIPERGLADLKKKIAGEVVEARRALLYALDEHNRSWVSNTGANDHITCEADPQAVQAALRAGSSLNDALATSRAVVVKRVIPVGTELKGDGLGPMGGLTETTMRIFPKLNLDKLADRKGAGGKEMLAYLKNVLEEKEKIIPAARVKEDHEHVLATTRLLIEYLKADDPTQELKKKIMDHLDDLIITTGKDGKDKITLEEDPVKVAKRNQGREEPEEGGGVTNRLVELRMNGKAEDSQRFMMGGKKIYDDLFFLNNGLEGIDFEKPSFAVHPAMLSTKVSSEGLDQFIADIAQDKREGKSFVNPTNLTEVSGLEVRSLNDLRRRGGINKEGKPLHELVKTDRDGVGQYAYVYPHELAGGPWKLTFLQIVNALRAADGKVDPEKLKEALCRLVKEDQGKVFTEDRHDHQINFLCLAKTMARGKIEAEKQKASALGKDFDAEAFAYEALADIFEIEGLNADTFKAMDTAAAEEHREQGGFHAEAE